MVRRKDDSDPDRFLMRKRGLYYYQRRVPLQLQAQDLRGPLIRKGLETKEVGAARKRRDDLEAADNALWDALGGTIEDPARARFAAALKRVEAMGFSYASAEKLSEIDVIEQLLDRIESIPDTTIPVDVEAAVLGGAIEPRATLKQASKLFLTEIAADEQIRKSAQQRRKWKNVRQRSVDSFVAVVGNKEMVAITREDALKFWRFWQKRIAPTEPGARPTHTASSGNREISTMRTIYAAYFSHLGDRDRVNPFAGLSFKERGANKRIRPPFPSDWIKDQLLRPGALETMNIEARAILLAMIETGARPSELANLLPESIMVSEDVPHIIVQPRDDPDDPRELKTETSERTIPLVGIALTVFQEFPYGFPRYREREEAASAAINKYLRENGLMPSPRHTLYGLRHSLEDRMKEAGLDEELRRTLMGHKIDREQYGTGGGIKWRRDELQKIALPFDPTVVTTSRVPPPARRGAARR